MEPTYSPTLERFIDISSGLGEDDTLDAQREAYSLSSQILQLQMPEAVDFYDESIRTRDYDVPVRHYRLRDVTPDALIVFFHGGGWVKGDLNWVKALVERPNSQQISPKTTSGQASEEEVPAT